MAAPKPIIVEGVSCGHPVYIQGGKDVLAVTGGTRDAAIEAAKANAKCPAGIESSTVIPGSERSSRMTVIDGSASRYERIEKSMNAAAGIGGDQCYSIQLSIVCADPNALKAKLSAPATSPKSSSAGSQTFHERGTGSVAPGTPPPESGRKGPWKGPAKSL